MSDEADAPGFDVLLDYLKRTRGFDFGAYKRHSLIRRMQKRLQMVGIESFHAYADYLEVHPEEFEQLFNAILINVTAFFRDESAWEYLRDEALPPMLAGPTSQPIRVWTAGCASGEETYSIAILLAEALGRDHFRDRVKIYATDFDEHALNQARLATYAEKDLEAVAPALREKYFTREGERFVFDKDLRRSVIFGRHDLVQYAPISRVTLLTCRNTLMYFNLEAQSRMLARFHFALSEHGILFLGKAEMLLAHTQLFAPIDLRRRMFRKVSRENWRERITLMNQAAGDEPYGGSANHMNLYPAAFDANPQAQVVIDGAGRLAMFNERARLLLNIAPSDLGRPFQDLEMSYRPLDLRSLIQQAIEQRHAISVKELEWPLAGRDSQFFDVHVTPLPDLSGRTPAVSIALTDVTRVQELHAKLRQSKQDLDTAYEELQSTNEELETTNEELQSTVEELETTNEELQSTNEELETMNEELQSTNEELQTTNEELRQRSDDLNGANSFLQSILSGVRTGVVVVDRELHVIAWNHRAEDLWGLRSDEVKGQNFLNLDIGLPLEDLRAGIRSALGDGNGFTELVVRAVNRRGKPIACKVTSTPLLGARGEVRGAILLMEEQPVTH